MSRDAAAWRQYWADGGGQDAVTAGKAGHALEQVWRSRLSALQAVPARIVDLACGLGPTSRAVRVVFGAAPQLVACDIADVAAANAASQSAGLAVAADSSRLSFKDGAFDLVVSQFGLEYAGAGAFAEAGRVLTDGGAGLAVVHMAGGSIERECAQNLEILDAILSARLLEAARDAVVHGRPRDLAGEGRLRSIAAASNALPNAAAARFAAAIAPDLARLAARPNAFDPVEATAYLDAQAHAVKAYHDRMASMTRAALDSNAACKALAAISRNRASELTTLSGPNGDYAWLMAVGEACASPQEA
ncbi:MAG: class I SAM-dependent methyltransferase [Oceanicaulis sp.]